MNKITANLWLILGIIAAICVIVKSAWWHLGTIAICWLMYSLMSEEDKTEDINH